VDKGYDYLWKEAYKYHYKALVMDQLDVEQVCQAFPVVLIQIDQFRKAYHFCLRWAYLESEFMPEERPIKERVSENEWIWGPDCCDRRLLENPFDVNNSDHDNFPSSFKPEHFRVSHLLAMIFIKWKIAKGEKVKFEGNPEEFKKCCAKQPLYIIELLKEIHSRNENILKAIVFPDPLLRQGEPRPVGSSGEGAKQYKYDMYMYHVVELYSHLFHTNSAIKILKAFLKCGDTPEYELDLLPRRTITLKGRRYKGVY
jgi:hypothetical protein